MMPKTLFESALQYHNEGLCVIPIVENDKRPALASWDEYHTQQSTEQEIRQWWGGHNYNIGIVHGEVSGNYVAIDIDHDSGLLDQLFTEHSSLFAGRIEQSGSGEGYHIPLRLDTLPDFGFDQRQGRPRGNKTWRTDQGSINLRCRFCQTVAPPSIHPSGNLYKFVKNGEITHFPNLDNLIAWLDEIAPPKMPEIKPPRKPIGPAKTDDLLSEVKAIWNCLKVFDHFGMAGNIRQERNGELRLLGNGGLLITDDLNLWYNFSDDYGGDCVTAWGYCRLGSAYDNTRHFKQMLLEMANVAGVATDKRTGQAITGDFPPLNIPPGDKIIIVAGEDKAEIMKAAGYCAVGLPGHVFKRQWARLFNPGSTVYIALDPDKDSQARTIASEFKANGMTAFTCSMPFPPDEMIRQGATAEDFGNVLKLGRRA